MANMHEAGRKVVEELRGYIENHEERVVVNPATEHGPDVILDGEIEIEVKKSTTSVSQVRPWEYEVLVIHHTHTDDQVRWYVIPPHIVMMRAVNGASKQHGHLPLECCNLGKPSPENAFFHEYEVEPKDIEKAIILAHAQGEKEDKFRKFSMELKKRYEDSSEFEKQRLEDKNRIEDCMSSSGFEFAKGKRGVVYPKHQ